MSYLIVRSPSTVDLVSDKGTHTLVELPDAATVDAKFIEMWLHRKAEKTITAYSADIARMYAHVGKSLRELTLEDIQDYINTLLSLKPSSQARMIASLKSALSFACKTGYIQFNVGAVVKLPKLEDCLAERIMGEEDVVRMFALEQNTRNHAILVLLYRGGLRASEVSNLEWRHLTNRDGGTGQVAIHGKGSKTRFVLLDKKTWQELMALKKDKTVSGDDYVFQSRKLTRYEDEQGQEIWSRRIDESQIHRIVKQAAARADVEVYLTADGVLTSKTSPHWMRHAHATHALERGTNIVLVKETLGHKSINTTTKYTHVRPNDSSSLHLNI